jgi:RNA polymerase sigma-70 factor, ECF subfamily
MAIVQSGFTGARAVLPWMTERVPSGLDRISKQNQYRIYALAFWMTDNELVAEQIAASVITQTILAGGNVVDDELDRVFLAEIRSMMPIGKLSLECAPVTEELNVRRNTKRVHLERAVAQLPPTERLIFVMHDVDGYEQTRIAHLLGINVNDCVVGLHQAHLRLRELLAAVVN